jgi:hypothetical protein
MRPYLIALVTALSTVVALNQVMSARGADDRVLQLAKAQRSDQLLVSRKEFDARTWVKARLTAGADCADVVVLGSSTVGQFAADMFPGQKFLNAWMGGPTIEDFEAVAFMMKSASCRPSTIIIGVDPWWIANPEVNDERWLPLFREYVAYHAADGAFATARIGAPVAWNLFKDKLTFVTTAESANALWRAARGHTEDGARLVDAPPEQFCKTIDSEYTIRSADGHYTTCPVFANSVEEVERRARDYLPGDKHHMGSWASVDTARIDRLGAFLRDWARSAHVVIVAMPYHPVTYAAMQANARVARNLAETDARLTAVAGDVGAQFLNLRDPTVAGCSAVEFEDSHHSGRDCVAKIATTIARTLPNGSR